MLRQRDDVRASLCCLERGFVAIYVAGLQGRGYLLPEVFGVSLTEFVLILVVALVVLGPQRLPGMLRTVGLWINKVRRMTTEVRAQTGIDDLLRNEGFHGGLAEVRALLRGDPRTFLQPSHSDYAAHPSYVDDPYVNGPPIDESRERPVEGPDAYGAIAEDLLDEAHSPTTVMSTPTAQTVSTVANDAPTGKP